MKIITLAENTTQNPALIAEHGLCIYIETAKHKLLVDTGSSDALLHNALALGIDLTQVDTVILSHGHYDHSGGILPFAGINPHAKIYMQKKALDDYYHGERYIGIDKKIARLPQVQLLDGDFKIDDELSLFTNITGRRFWPVSNIGLAKRIYNVNSECEAAHGSDIHIPEPKYVEQQDQFDHEQCLVITQGEEKILLSGCAHNGILNLLDHYQTLYHDLPQMVISGFHMMKKTGDYTAEEASIITQTAEELGKLNIKFYTGHCTGQPAYDMMKPIMGNKLQQISTGTTIK